MTIAQTDLDGLVRRTQALVDEVKALDDVSPALDSVQSGIRDFERIEDVAVDMLLPSEAAAAGFLKIRSPKAFVLALVCTDDRASEEILVALGSGTSAVVSTVVGLLTIGAGVAIALAAVSAIAVGIAALMITKGLNGACAEASS